MIYRVTNCEHLNCPHRLASLYYAFSAQNWGRWNDVRGRHEILALFLNVVSNRLQTLEVISADGATVSQALQQIAAQIDDYPQDEEAAKDLAETLNSGREVAAGVIDLSLPVIPYGRPHPWAPPGAARDARGR